jgi:hypothetical protein
VTNNAWTMVLANPSMSRMVARAQAGSVTVRRTIRTTGPL